MWSKYFFQHCLFFLSLNAHKSIILNTVLQELHHTTITGFVIYQRYIQNTQDTDYDVYSQDKKQNCLIVLLFIRTSVTQRVLSGHVVSRQDTNRNNTKCMLSVRHHYNTTPVTPCSAEHFVKCVSTFSLCSYSRSHKPQENCLYSECTGWCSLNSSALDIHCKHMASKLHVPERVSWDHHWCWISSGKCHTELSTLIV